MRLTVLWNSPPPTFTGNSRFNVAVRFTNPPESGIHLQLG